MKDLKLVLLLIQHKDIEISTRLGHGGQFGHLNVKSRFLKNDIQTDRWDFFKIAQDAECFYFIDKQGNPSTLLKSKLGL